MTDNQNKDFNDENPVDIKQDENLDQETEMVKEAQDTSEQEDEALKLKDQLLRTMAELENVRKRTDREREDTAKYAISSFARDMLNVSDNLRRAIDAVPEGAADADPALKALIEGVEITENELLNSLEKHGIKKIDPQPGDSFDHNVHQAMLEIPSTEHKPGTIAQVMQVGYVIHDRLLRPALVGVAKE